MNRRWLNRRWWPESAAALRHVRGSDSDERPPRAARHADPVATRLPGKTPGIGRRLASVPSLLKQTQPSGPQPCGTPGTIRSMYSSIGRYGLSKSAGTTRAPTKKRPRVVIPKEPSEHAEQARRRTRAETHHGPRQTRGTERRDPGARRGPASGEWGNCSALLCSALRCSALHGTGGGKLNKPHYTDGVKIKPGRRKC